jgi:hypothetical protein
MEMWIKFSERKPPTYRTVTVELLDGTQHVGRLNQSGTFETASYQKCKAQYGIRPEHIAYWYQIPVRE